MATVSNTISLLTKPIELSKETFFSSPLSKPSTLSSPYKRKNHIRTLVESIIEDPDVMKVKTNDTNDQRDTLLDVKNIDSGREQRTSEKLISRSVNATIVLVAGTFAVTKMLTVDHDYWHGWTLYEILRYAPEHNWIAYEEALNKNPVLAKMIISGAVYSIGDWIAQCYEGKPLFEFNPLRVVRSGIVGFSLHGSLSHYYYQICEALFPFKDWWVVPAKVAFDQTIWAAIWNSIYFVVLGFLRFESPSNISNELKTTFWPMLTAGWKLWPFTHLITYGVIPVEQRILWVDCVELIWVTILSTYSNEKSESQIAEMTIETTDSSLPRNLPKDQIGTGDSVPEDNE